MRRFGSFIANGQLLRIYATVDTNLQPRAEKDTPKFSHQRIKEVFIGQFRLLFSAWLRFAYPPPLMIASQRPLPLNVLPTCGETQRGATRLGDMKSKNGFTLISVVFALGILTIGILSILSLYPLGHRSVSRSKAMTITALIAERELNKIRGLYSSFDSPDPPGEISGRDPDFAKFSWRAIISGKEIYTVDLEVTWEERRKKEHEFFTTEFTKH